MATAEEEKDAPAAVTTLIFDVDDTLYDVRTGFSENRNYYGAPTFMMERLGFSDFETAKKVRDEYFARFHSTAKALRVAEEEGAFPSLPQDDEDSSSKSSRRFREEDLDEFFATRLDFSLLGGAKTQLLQDLKECKLEKIAFSNGPRAYVKRVLQELGLWEIFGEERLFAVNDVLPHCKPEKEAFDVVFKAFGLTPKECIMVEDSMKNVRRAKALGLKTVLVTGKKASGEEEKDRYDAPEEEDPHVDVAIETAEQLRSALPGLWETPPVFR